MRISSPEKVARLLDKVGHSGLPLLIRSLKVQSIAVKARALSSGGSSDSPGFKMGNISDRGLQFLTQNKDAVFQIEFTLASEKVIFTTKITNLTRQCCVVAIPKFIESVERRKSARVEPSENLRAYVGFERLAAVSNDYQAPPVFESSQDLSALIPVSDISVGGVALISRFPFVSRLIKTTTSSERAFLYLPMTAPIALDGSIRWNRQVAENTQAIAGQLRVITSYKFGLQFVDPNQTLQNHVQMFIQRLSQADAI